MNGQLCIQESLASCYLSGPTFRSTGVASLSVYCARLERSCENHTQLLGKHAKVFHKQRSGVGDGRGHGGTRKVNPKPCALKTRHYLHLSMTPLRALEPISHARHWRCRETYREPMVTQRTQQKCCHHKCSVGGRKKYEVQRKQSKPKVRAASSAQRLPRGDRGAGPCGVDRSSPRGGIR